MTNSIEQLSAKLEELDKRLKALSTTQNISIAVMNMRDYIHETKTFLSDLLSAYQNHISTSNNYSQQIENLQTQLNQISQKIDSILSAENFDPNQITADIEALQNSLSTLSAESADAIQNLQNQISENSQNISNVSTTLNQTTATANQNQADIQSLTTQTTNLQTAQTNLSTTQTNLTSTVSNLNSRLTSAEQEITALNGGVDLTELDERVADIESVAPVFSLVDTKTLTMNQTFNNVQNYFLREFAFNNSSIGKTFARFTINFSSESNLEHTFAFYANGGQIKSLKVNTNNYSNEFTTDIFHDCFYSTSTFAIKLTTLNEITINSVTVDFFSKNALYIDYDPEIYVCCFNNEIYVTKRTTNSYQFGKFSSDNLSITDFQYEISRNFNNKINRLFFVPMTSGTNGTFESVQDSLVTYEADLYARRYINIDETMSNLIENGKYLNVYTYRNPNPVYFHDYSHLYAESGSIFFLRPFYANTTISLNITKNVKINSWSFCTPVINNYQTINSTYHDTSSYSAVCLNEDGYFYFLKKGYPALKLIKGQFATAYEQQDGTINVYIRHSNRTYKHVISLGSNGNYYAEQKSMIMAYKIFEVLDGKTIRQTSSGWSIK